MVLIIIFIIKDVGKSASFVCRPSNSICDIPEVCGKSKTECPIDIIKIIDNCGVCGGDNSSCTPAGNFNLILYII